MPVIGDTVSEAVRHTRLADFTRAADCRWVGEPVGFIRQIFEFTAIKGAVYSARWGWSVDFVPLLQGRILKWKRSPARAQFDLCIDPIDVTGFPPAWGSFGESESPARIAKAAMAALQAANESWADVHKLQDLTNLYWQRSRMSFRRFSLENYVQTDLAWGLCLIALGQVAAGQQHLGKFCDQFGIDAENALLRKARVDAAALASLDSHLDLLATKSD